MGFVHFVKHCNEAEIQSRSIFISLPPFNAKSLRFLLYLANLQCLSACPILVGYSDISDIVHRYLSKCVDCSMSSADVELEFDKFHSIQMELERQEM